MKIIISPAKKMNVTDALAWSGMPVFLEQAEELKRFVQGLSYEEAKALWKCSDKLARLNYERFVHMELSKNLTPAILSYEGIQYQYMAPAVMEASALEYIQEHLRSLSGFYGVLKPFDGVVPYRLEMQARARVNGCRDLYDFWGDRIYREVISDGCPDWKNASGGNRSDRRNASGGNHPDRKDMFGGVIVNLASKEYAKCVETYAGEHDRLITVVFGEEKNGRVVQKGTMAKMARGEMVRYMAEKRIETPEEIQSFDRLNYVFRPERSSAREYVFTTNG